MDRRPQQRRQPGAGLAGEGLMAKLGKASAWFATGKLLDASRARTDRRLVRRVCRGGCAWRCGHGRLDSQLWNQPRSIQLAPFTAAVFRAGLFERVGLLDERFESYLEDVDFGLRCAQAGLKWLICPGSGGLSPGQRDAGALASGHGAEDSPQSVAPGGETLSAGLGLTLWLASLHRSDFMGIRRASARGACKLSCGQSGRSAAVSRRRRPRACQENPASPIFLPS